MEATLHTQDHQDHHDHHGTRVQNDTLSFEFESCCSLADFAIGQERAGRSGDFLSHEGGGHLCPTTPRQCQAPSDLLIL